jgi:site-specific recombinase XerD
MKAVPSLATLLQRFFTERLMQQRQASPHTISAYRDTFRLLLKFTSKRLRNPPDRIAFEDVDAPLIGAFLNDLQKSRNIATRSRNARLAAIRSFFNFAAFEMPSRSSQIQRVLAIPTKRYVRAQIDYLILEAGVDTSVIALWLGHESVETTQVYLTASLALKEKILAKTTPHAGRPGCYRSDDKLLGFLNTL